MLPKTAEVLETAIASFTARGIRAVYFSPTRTGLEHSLLDATAQVREFLAETGMHDFEAQAAGVESKVVLPINILGTTGMQASSISLYRPATKDGRFTRMWISGLPAHAEPDDVIALIVGVDGTLNMANCSRGEVLPSIDDRGAPLGALVASLQEASTGHELRGLLCDISRRGFVPSMRAGDTGIGYTLETLLGIKANSNKAPDYKGIELKSGRAKQGNKTTLFSKTPDWRRSAASRADLIPKYGYFDPKEARMALYCTVGPVPNTQGLFLQVDDDEDHVEVRHRSDAGVVSPVMVWDLPVLEASLLQKHRETFWVKALTQTAEGTEQFHYVSAVHTQAPIAANLGPLIKTGHVTLDLVMHIRANGSVRDHGFLWRIDPRHRALLFPEARVYDLTAGRP